MKRSVDEVINKKYKRYAQTQKSPSISRGRDITGIALIRKYNHNGRFKGTTRVVRGRGEGNSIDVDPNDSELRIPSISRGRDITGIALIRKHNRNGDWKKRSG